ncbi:MAG: hypothetical protein AAF518_28475 [Spirochaetota bacterium]
MEITEELVELVEKTFEKFEVDIPYSIVDDDDLVFQGDMLPSN